MLDRPGGSASDWRYSYSSWGQLTLAERTPGSSDVLYTTDALDRVLSRTSGGATASFTYAGLGESLARAVVGATSTLYAWTPGGPLAQKVGSTTRHYVGDQHGDTVGWTDTTGTLKGTALYDPWGQVLSSTGEMANVPSQGAFRFQSDLTDASTGQVDMGVRAYEPTLGRFSSPDLLFGDPLSPPSLNRFTYAVGNPVTLSDPTGLMPVCGEGCTRQEEADLIRGYASSFTQAGASEYSPALDAPSPPSPQTAMTIRYRLAAARYYPWVGTTGAHNHVVDALKDELCSGGLFHWGESACATEVPLGPGNRADLVNFSTAELYEVKPDKARWLPVARLQLARYLTYLHKESSEEWHAGGEFGAFTTNYRGHDVLVRWAEPGIALYRPTCSPNCDPGFSLDQPTLIWRIKSSFLVKVLLLLPEVVRVPVPV